MDPPSSVIKRAKAACKVCNARRVRCNAVEKQPCDNCRAKGLICVLVKSRRGKRPTRNGESSPNCQVETQSLATDVSNSPPIKENVRTSQSIASVLDPSPSNGDGRYHQSGGIQRAENTGNVQSPENARAETIASSRSGAGARRNVFLGEASSVGWTEIATEQRRPNPSSREGSVRLLFAAPPEQSEDLSPSSLVRSTRQAKRIEYLRSIGTFDVPNDEVLEEMLRAYFKWFHPCFPIIDRVSFYHDYTSKSVSPLLLQAVLFIAATYFQPSQLQDLGFMDLPEARATYYNHAKDIYDADYEEDQTATIQALFLMSYFREGPQKNTRRCLAAAVSLAQELGMHRARTSVTERAEQSLRKRIWWTLYIRDRQASISVGIPWFTQDQGCDVEELTEEDFYEEPSTEAFQFLDRQSNEQIQYPIQMARLARIIGDIVNTEFRLVNKRTAVSERAKLKDCLSKWEGELPEGMKPRSGLGYGFNLYASMLNAYYYNAYILLYRSSYVRNKGEPTDEEEQDIALQAACKITSIAEDLLTQNMMRYVHTHMITSFFNSLCVHTICLRRSNDIGRQIAEKRAQICLLGLQELKKTWDVNNWILKVYFEHLEKPIKNRIQIGDNASYTDQQSRYAENIVGLGSDPTRAASAMPNDPPTYPPPDPLNSVWSSAFFNSTEAENFSLYQLEPGLFGGESFDFAFDPYAIPAIS